MRCVVSVATGPHYITNQIRMCRSLPVGTGTLIFADQLPPGSPTHAESPYQFKVHAIEEAIRQGATTILWMDSSVVVLNCLDPLWELIEKQGYWFSRNYNYNNGQFCSDEALAIMRMTRKDAFSVPHVTAGCFGLDIRCPDARAFLESWKTLALLGAFQGDRGDLSGGNDPHKFYGHRNDQACASYVIHALGMKLTDPPDWWAEQGRETNERTILTLER